MKLRLLIVFALFLFSFTSNAQEKVDIENSYLEYFKLPRETLFLHTNKTTFITGEDIWFKAYAYDRKNELSSKTTKNIYFGLYNKYGVQVDKKLYLTISGAASGSFHVNPSLDSGEYFLKVSTNWMKNFKEDDSYVQKIRIINPKKQAESQKKVNRKEYDFQFLPEGGHIVSDVKNSIGVKAIDDTGKGTSSSGIILNSNNEEVSRFKSNFLGLGKFTFTPKKGETYTAKVTLDNEKEFEQKLPSTKDIGVAIIVNNMNPGKVIITLNTNDVSSNYFKNTSLKLAIHKDGKIKSIPVVFDSKSKQIVIAKDKLYKGMNTITLFNQNNQPILERMFFNNSSIANYSFNIEQIKGNSDSIIYRLISKDIIDDKLLNASISVLPGKTISYSPDHTIATAIHLKPYLRGLIENSQYYFKNFNRKKQFELDVLILTQGWSRYSWDNIFNFPPKPSYDFENGVSINGFVNKKGKNYTSIFLYPTKQNKSTFIPIDVEGKFNIKNFYPQANEEINFSYLDKNGSLKKPNMSLSYIKLMDKDVVNTRGYRSFYSFYKYKNNIPEQFILDDSYQELDEIQIKSDLRKKLWRETKDPILINGKVTKITDKEINRYPNITDLIQNKGFDVRVVDGFSIPSRLVGIGTSIGGTKLGDVIISSRRINTSGNFGASPTLFIDGVIVSDFNILLNMNTDRVEKIIIDKTAVGLGLSGGFGGAIKIYTRRGPLTRNSNINSTSFTNVSSYGFEPVQEFYTPLYSSYQMQSYKDYGIIHWNPKVIISKNGSGFIKVKNTNQEEINFYIEGIGSDGNVFSQKIKVDTSKI
jgi:hypothetical protein